MRLGDRNDAAAWREFEALYAPLLYRYARARGLEPADAEDVRATCYLQLVQQMGRFEYRREKGGFKAWLRTLVNRRVVDHLRRRREKQAATEAFAEVPDAGADPLALWEEEWRRQHLAWCLERARAELPAEVCEAFRLLVDCELPVSEVGERLG